MPDLVVSLAAALWPVLLGMRPLVKRMQRMHQTVGMCRVARVPRLDNSANFNAEQAAVHKSTDCSCSKLKVY